MCWQEVYRIPESKIIDVNDLELEVPEINDDVQ